MIAKCNELLFFRFHTIHQLIWRIIHESRRRGRSADRHDETSSAIEAQVKIASTLHHNPPSLIHTISTSPSTPSEHEAQLCFAVKPYPKRGLHTTLRWQRGVVLSLVVSPIWFVSLLSFAAGAMRRVIWQSAKTRWQARTGENRALKRRDSSIAVEEVKPDR